MSVTTFQCDTCKRETDLLQQPNSLVTVGRCTITQGCRGSLYPTGERLTGSSTSSTDIEDGLIDFIPRITKYDHTQSISNSVWIIQHNLDASPAAIVHMDIEDGLTTYVDPDDYVVNFVDNNNTRIEFANKITGVAQLLPRSGTKTTVKTLPSDTITTQLTGNSILTIGRLFGDVNPDVINSTISFASPATGTVRDIPITMNAHKSATGIALFNTPWQSVNTISLGGNVYKVYSIDINVVLNLNSIESGSPYVINAQDSDIILIPNAPFSSNIVDANTVNYVISPSMIISAAASNTTTINSELFIDSSEVLKYHPSLKVTTTIYN